MEEETHTESGNGYEVGDPMSIQARHLVRGGWTPVQRWENSLVRLGKESYGGVCANGHEKTPETWVRTGKKLACLACVNKKAKCVYCGELRIARQMERHIAAMHPDKAADELTVTCSCGKRMKGKSIRTHRRRFGCQKQAA